MCKFCLPYPGRAPRVKGGVRVRACACDICPTLNPGSSKINMYAFSTRLSKRSNQTVAKHCPDSLEHGIRRVNSQQPNLAVTASVQCSQDRTLDRLVGLVVRRPPLERKIPGSNPACAGIFSGSSHTSDLKIGTPVATLPGAWRYRVSTGTG